MTPKQYKQLHEELHAIRVCLEDAVDRIIVALSSVS